MFPKIKWNKDVFRYTKTERIHYEQTGTLRNVIESPAGRRKIVSGRNTNLRREGRIPEIITTWVNSLRFSLKTYIS